MKSSTFLRSLIWSLCCIWTAEAQYAFKVPSGDINDLDPTLTIVQGTIAEFVWTANTTYQPTLDGTKILDADGQISLWLTSWATHDFGRCLAASVYSTTGGSWGWKVNLTDDEIDNNEGKFVYRLYPPVSSTSVPYEDIPNQIPSRGFYIRKASEIAASSASAAAAQSASRSRAADASRSDAAAESSTTQSVATTTQTGSVSTTASTTLPTGAAQNTSGTLNSTSSPSSGISTGAKAGIAIGVVALALIAAVAIFFVLRRRRAKPSSTPAELSGQSGVHHEDKTMYAQHGNGAPHYQHAYVAPPSEMEAPAQNQRTYELAGSQAREP